MTHFSFQFLSFFLPYYSIFLPFFATPLLLIVGSVGDRGVCVCVCYQNEWGSPVRYPIGSRRMGRVWDIVSRFLFWWLSFSLQLDKFSPGNCCQYVGNTPSFTQRIDFISFRFCVRELLLLLVLFSSLIVFIYLFTAVCLLQDLVSKLGGTPRSRI